MHTISQVLGDDHQRCDSLFAEAETAVAQGDWLTGESAFNAFHDALEHHFRMEEEVMFPEYEARTGQTMGPTRVMRMEHGQMRQLKEDMATAITARDRDRYLGLSETLLIVMQQHNAKEEQMLYPMADRALQESMEQVLSQMDAV